MRKTFEARIGSNFRGEIHLERNGKYFNCSGATLVEFSLVEVDRVTPIIGPIHISENDPNNIWSAGIIICKFHKSDWPVSPTVKEHEVLLQVKVILNGEDYFWPDALGKLLNTSLG